MHCKLNPTLMHIRLAHFPYLHARTAAHRNTCTPAHLRTCTRCKPAHLHTCPRAHVQQFRFLRPRGVSTVVAGSVIVAVALAGSGSSSCCCSSALPSVPPCFSWILVDSSLSVPRFPAFLQASQSPSPSLHSSSYVRVAVRCVQCLVSAVSV